MNENVKKDIQERINSCFQACEELKDKIAIMQYQYNARVAYLEKLCAESGLSANAETIKEFSEIV